MPAGKLKGLDFLVGMSPPGAMSGGGSAGGGGGSGGGSAAEADADGQLETAPDDMLVGAASDIQSAFRERDPERIAAALQAFVRMC